MPAYVWYLNFSYKIHVNKRMHNKFNLDFRKEKKIETP